MNRHPKKLRLTASLVTCLSLAGCVGGQLETTAPYSGIPATSTGDGLCTATQSAMTVSVGDTFADGEWVRDFYSGEKARVENGEVTLTPAPEAEGLLLLEAANAPEQSFNWAGATVYFTVTDRFANGRTDNDWNYGRKPDGMDEIGTFHGGDFAGLTEKLDYLGELGVNAIWITPPFEQIHGWVGGGDRGDFQHYGYHGYYALDFTRPDANFGTREEFRVLIEEAHARGIRVVMDVVMNHPGYATLQDMQTFNFGGLREGFEKHLPAPWGHWQPESWEDFHAYHALIDYDNPGWSNWWGKDWVRASIGDYETPPNASIDPVRGSLSFLPDFKTESTKTVDLPVFLREKENTRARQLDDTTVRDYLITWLTDWVREFGVDGFRVDTAKHVEPEAWLALKAEAQKALDNYRSNNPGQPLPAEDFWMVAEVFPHTVTRSSYFDAGFDAVINFDLQEEVHAGAACLPEMEPIYSDYAEKMNSDKPFNVMSYISSHDTQLFSRIADNNPAMQKRVASALLFTPGTSQIFYGDETGRRFGPTGSDGHQGTRSDMNWADIDNGKAKPVLSHWKKLGQFRARHPAIGAGEHKRLSTEPYVFSRTHGNDRVVIAFGKE